MMFRNSRFLPIRLPAGNLHKQLLDYFIRLIPNGGSRCHGIDYHQAKELLLKTIFDTRGNLCHGAHTHSGPLGGRSSLAGGDDNFPKQHPTHTLTHWLVVGCCGQRRRDGTETFFWPRALSHFYFLPLFLLDRCRQIRKAAIFPRNNVAHDRPSRRNFP